MTAIILHRTDPAKNMRRFYRLDIQPDLFGGFLLMKRDASARAGGSWPSVTTARLS
jgi:predicted DNA-binding WGR domain protein